MNTNIYGEFYSPLKLVSTNKPLCMSVGSRSIGKSTGFGIYFLTQYYEKGKKFIYCRRTDDELKRTAADYFGTPLSIMAHNGITHAIELKGDTYTDESNNIVGYAIALNNEQKYKSMPFGDLGVKNILYDEFILPRGGERGYLGGSKNLTYEYDRLISLYQTVDREKGKAFRNDTRIYCCANNASFYNPLFLACHCDKFVSLDTKFCNPKKELWALELTNTVPATSKIKQSYGYLLASDSDKSRNYDNDSMIRDSQVQELHGVVTPLCNIKYSGNIYGVYVKEDIGICYVCERPADGRITIALTIGDTTEINYITAYKFKDSGYMIFLRDMVTKGKCVFQTGKIKNDILTYLNYTI